MDELATPIGRLSRGTRLSTFSDCWSPAMQHIEAVLSDLEWRRVRRRVALNPALALLRNCATAALIIVLKLVR